MHRVHRALLLSAAAAVAVVLAAGARGTGTINTGGGSDIGTGTAPAPGTLTINPCAGAGATPPLPDVGDAGPAPAMTGAMPALGSTGDGSDGIFASGSSATLPGGTYEYTSFTLDSLATLEFSGAVTILVQGNVDIHGSLVTATDGASITLRCGGSCTLRDEDPGVALVGVRATGTASDISIAAGAGLSVGQGGDGRNCRVEAAAGTITLQDHGALTTLSVVNGEVLSTTGAVTLRAAHDILVGGDASLNPGTLTADGGPLLVQAFGDLDVRQEVNLSVPDGSSCTLEAAGRFDWNAYLYAGGTRTLVMKAVLGPLFLTNSVGANDGAVSLLSGGAIDFSGDVEASVYGDGALTLRAVTGDIHFHGDDTRAYAGDGPFDAAAGGSILLEGESTFGGYAAVTVRATGGDILLGESGTIQSSDGPVVLRASNAVRLGVPYQAPVLARPGATSAGGEATVRGGSVEISAGAGGVLLDAATARATAGNFTVIADGLVSISQSVTALGDILLTSRQDGIDVANATLATDARTGTPSGSVSLDSWLDTGTIEAYAASLRSGNADASSGDVSLLVHAGTGGPLTVESFVLPKKIVAKVNLQDATKSRFVAAGFLDTGGDAVDLSGPATVKVGGIEVDVPGFTADASGTKFTYAGDGLLVSILASKAGSSRAKFRLAYTGDFGEDIDTDGNCRLEFAGAGAAGTGTVGLDAGKYALGKRRGALVTPNLYLARAKAALKGEGKDGFSLVAGLATNGTTPEAAATVTVGFGDLYSVTIPGEAFTAGGDRFTYKSADGSVQVVLDYLKETVTAKVKNVDLGEFEADASAVLVTVGLGADQRGVRVRMGHRGKALVY